MKKTAEPIPTRVSISKSSIHVIERLRTLNKTQMHAVLATDSEGQPYTSLIAYSLTPDLKGVVFATPKSTRKHKNILRNKRVSLLIDTRSNTGKDYMNAESITLIGKAYPLRKGKRWSDMALILKRKHPELSEFIESQETALFLVQITKGIHVTKFQSVYDWDVK